jgi:hypothetical protein
VRSAGSVTPQNQFEVPHVATVDQNIFSTEIQSALIEAGATLLAAVLGFWFVARQIKHEARLALHQRVYEQVVGACGPASPVTIDFSDFLRQVQQELEGFAASEKTTADYQRVRSRIPELLQRKSQMADTQIAVIGMIERWLIVDPRINVFKLAFSASMHETWDEFFPKYFSLVMDKLPADLHRENESTIVLPPKPCTPEELHAIRFLGEKMIAESENFLGYLYDFQVEMQRLLLRDLFKHDLPVREPIDPNIIVLNLRNHRALTKLFIEETAWGRYMKAIEDDTRRKFDAGRSELRSGV